MFRFDPTLSDAERKVLIAHHGELAVENHAVFLANFHRVRALFPPDHTPPTMAMIIASASRPDAH